jgi:hypothetical protein
MSEAISGKAQRSAAVLAPDFAGAQSRQRFQFLDICLRQPGELICVNAVSGFWALVPTMAAIHSLPEKWLPVSIAPADRDLEVCVIHKG